MEQAHALLFSLVKKAAKSAVELQDYSLVYAYLTDPEFGIVDAMIPHVQYHMQHMFKANKSNPDSPNYNEAMNGPHAEAFMEAMNEEIRSLEEHSTWTIMRRSALPEGANILPGTWVFKIKRYPDGRFRKTKARFCVRGDKQIEGIDYSDKYAPVVSWSTVRLLLCLRISNGWKTRQVDFSNAFVQAELKEDVYVSLPARFAGPRGEGNDVAVMKLNRSLYGLVQAPLYWYNHLKDSLGQIGFKPSGLDACLFYGNGMIVLVYVDDCLFFGPDQDKIDEVIANLRNNGLTLTVEADDAYAFLGVDVRPNEEGGYTMTQDGLTNKVLRTVSMGTLNSKATPADASPLGSDGEGEPFSEGWGYASVVGMLLYLSSDSRPDIQFAVHQCARFTHNPKKSHAAAIKRICRYLQATKGKGLEFTPTKKMELDCYVDADFAGLWKHESDQDPVCVKSRTGYVITLGGCPVIWVSKLQTEIALSTLEAEYIALSSSMRDLVPMRRLLFEIGEKLKLDFVKPAMIHSTIFEDNNGALGLAKAPKLTPRTKHIAVKYHWFKDQIGEEKGFIIEKVESRDQKADIFTKGLPSILFAHVRKLLMGW
jgi:histone deacetylase 1/2